MRETQSAAPNRDSNMVLDAIRKNSLAPPLHDPPQSIIQSPPPPPSGGSPPRPQLKRYALSDAPPTGPVRATSPVRKLRRNQERNTSSTSLANDTSARFVSGPGRAPSPGRTPRTKLTADDMGPVPTTPGSEAFNVPPSVNDDGTNIPTSGPSKRPTTFAEMGFHGVKAQEKECIIM